MHDLSQSAEIEYFLFFTKFVLQVLPSAAVLYFLAVINPILNVFTMILYTVLLHFSSLRLQ
jgi:hypothetical protein